MATGHFVSTDRLVGMCTLLFLCSSIIPQLFLTGLLVLRADERWDGIAAVTDGCCPPCCGDYVLQQHCTLDVAHVLGLYFIPMQRDGMICTHCEHRVKQYCCKS